MKLRFFTIAVTSVLLLVGCQGNNNEEGMRNRDQTIQPTRYEDNQIYPDSTRNTNRNNDGNQNYDQMRNDRNRGQTSNRNNMNDSDNRYDVAEEAADRITSEVNEVESAYVLTTKNNAYVAVVINQDNNDEANNKNNATNKRRGTADNDRGDTTNRRGNTNIQPTRNMTNSTNDGGDDYISDDLKRQIADIVQSVDEDIDNVYVSTNPDFVDLTNSYINDVNGGRPVRGFFDQIGNMIERIFPQNR